MSTQALPGQTVVLIGGSAGIGLETARLARAEGAEVVLTGRDRERLERAAQDVGARSTAAFDANDAAALKRFFGGLPGQIDHVLVTAGGPHYGPMLEMDADRGPPRARRSRGGGARGRAPRARQDEAGRHAAAHGRHRRPEDQPRARHRLRGHRRAAAVHGRARARARPVRVNLIAAGFVDTPLSASLLGDDLDKRREELRTTLPIGRVVGPADVAALAVHLMTNTALTGATYDIDGGQQFVSEPQAGGRSRMRSSVAGRQAAAVAVAREQVQAAARAFDDRPQTAVGAAQQRLVADDVLAAENAACAAASPRRHGEQVVAGPVRAAAGDERRARTARSASRRPRSGAMNSPPPVSYADRLRPAVVAAGDDLVDLVVALGAVEARSARGRWRPGGRCRAASRSPASCAARGRRRRARGAGPAVLRGLEREQLAVERRRVLRQRGLARVAGADVQPAVGAEGDPPGVVDRAGADAVDAATRSRTEPPSRSSGGARAACRRRS